MVLVKSAYYWIQGHGKIYFLGLEFVKTSPGGKRSTRPPATIESKPGLLVGFRLRPRKDNAERSSR